ncbi:mitotic-spindle organizing protein 2-like isoform X3 [Colius striatus]|uniref:mitotic-spindle organizing protein 2-like isoform X3 n=1 Tax=Colius striatus TaxID=57412 RepID=UPI002B1CE6C6|nr:mitotic-spindle organizing protein 2-like isoform X3 [Colius striatus]XP_061855038.1 mitotic-spindle organizing protein 2-like isoform X3 [Colius striatus]XP_061855039.1 mitotic-spindle organizing protein 2-like isoform X3 [Colius striatus]
MSEAAEGVAAAMAEVRLRRKQLLSAEEAELFELAQAAGSGLDAEVFRVLLDLLRMNVAPLAVFQMLKSMCAGQRLPPGPEGGPPVAPAPFPADTRGIIGRSGGARHGGGCCSHLCWVVWPLGSALQAFGKNPTLVLTTTHCFFTFI